MPHLYRTKDATGKHHAKWRFRYADYSGKRCAGTGFESKSKTIKLASQVQTYHDEIRRGLRPVPTATEKHKARPFDEVMQEYLAIGERQGGRGKRPWSVTHARIRRLYLGWWGEKLGLDVLGDLDACLPKVEEALIELREAGRSGKTLRNYAETLEHFISWCLRMGYLQDNPIKDLEHFDTTPKKTRRAMTQDELDKLLSAAPEYRRLLYITAFCSGLRAGELRALSVQDLDTTRKGLRLSPEWTKNRKPGFQPLPVVLVEELKAFAESGEAKRIYTRNYSRKDAVHPIPESPLLYVPKDPAKTFDRDLVSAKIEKTMPEGKLDFHACRVAYISLVVESGATVKEAQELARHSTPNLTMNIYARANDQRMADVVRRVGDRVLPRMSQISAKSKSGDGASRCNEHNYMAERVGFEPTVRF